MPRACPWPRPWPWPCLPLLLCALLASGLRRRAPGDDCFLESETTLDCSGLGLTRPPNDDFGTVTVLHLDFNQLSELRKQHLLSFPLLEELTVARNYIARLDDDALQGVRELRELDLTGNQLLSVHSVWFPDDLSALSVAANPLSPPAAGPLLNASGLDELSLEQCALAQLPEGALDAVPALRVLNLCYNSLREAALPALPRLERLHLCRNEVERLRLLGPMPALALLDLSTNRLGDLDASVWAGVPALRDLILSGNTLRFSGAAPFAPLGALRSLQLDECGLADPPQDLFRGLALQEDLYLDDNGLRSLGGLLRGQGELRYLYLDGNNLTSVEPEELTDCARLNTLSLADNRRLQRLPLATVSQLGDLRFLDITNTPLACSCAHAEIAAWAREQKVSLHDRCDGQGPCFAPTPAPTPTEPHTSGPASTPSPGGAEAPGLPALLTLLLTLTLLTAA